MAHQDRYEASDMAGMGKRVARAMARRAASGDVYALSAIVERQEALEVALVEGARGAHSFGYSWAEIAQEIGVTRQAAWERFGKRKGEEDGQPVGNAVRD